MRYIQRKVVKKIKTHVLRSASFFEYHAVYEIMWENIAEPRRAQMAIWRMRTACWITKAANTHSQYAILIAFPLQQWLHERASMLRYTYIACRFVFSTSQSQVAVVHSNRPRQPVPKFLLLA